VSEQPPQPPQDESRESSTEKPNLWRFAAIGAELFSPIVGGSVAGYFIDTHFHTGSIWTLVGLLGGVFLGFYRLIAETRSFRKNLRKNL
jgi:F0F1-type ATP synthase assembly protein I